MIVQNMHIYSNLNGNFSVLSREETDSHSINSGHYSDILQTRLWGKKKDSWRRTCRICKVGHKQHMFLMFCYDLHYLKYCFPHEIWNVTFFHKWSYLPYKCLVLVQLTLIVSNSVDSNFRLSQIFIEVLNFVVYKYI